MFTADIEKEAEYLARRSKTADAFVTEIKKANLIVKKLSGNQVDLNLLVPLGMATAGMATMGRRMPTPLWVTLGIFAFHSFVSLQVSGSGSSPQEL